MQLKHLKLKTIIMAFSCLCFTGIAAYGVLFSPIETGQTAGVLSATFALATWMRWTDLVQEIKEAKEQKEQEENKKEEE